MSFRLLAAGTALLFATPIFAQLAPVPASGPASALEMPAELPLLEPEPAKPVKTAPSKIAPPAATEIAAAGKQIDEVYGEEIAKAKTPALKIAAAKKLLALAAEEKTPRTKLALLTKTKSLATDAGDIETALATIEQSEATFDIDAIKQAGETLIAATRVLVTAPQRQAGYSAAKRWSQRAIAAERFDVARQLGDVCLSFARGTGDQIYIKEATFLAQVIRETGLAAEDAKQAAAALAANPEDPAANFKSGVYLALFKNNWEDGLPRLARGSDKTLAEIAKREATVGEGAEARLALADAWWDAAQSLSAVTKPKMLEHAGGIYHLVLPELTGVAKSKAEKRLQESAFRPESDPAAADPFLSKFLAKIPQELLPKNEDTPADAQAKLSSFQKWMLANRPIEKGSADVGFTAKFVSASAIKEYHPAGELTDGPRPQRYLIKFQLRMDTRATPVAVNLNVYKPMTGRDDPAFAAIAALEKAGPGATYYVTAKIGSLSTYFGKPGAKNPAYLGLTLLCTSGEYTAKAIEPK